MEIIARLRREREALVARLAEVDKMLRQYEELDREAQRLLSLMNRTASEVAQTRVATDNPPVEAASETVPEEADVSGRQMPPSTVPGTQRKTPMREFEAAVIDVLRNANQPMDRVAIYDALIDRGIVIGSGDRDKDLNTLSARVYRMAKNPKNRITGKRGEGYRLLDVGDTPEAENGGTDEDDADHRPQQPLVD